MQAYTRKLVKTLNSGGREFSFPRLLQELKTLGLDVVEDPSVKASLEEGLLSSHDPQDFMDNNSVIQTIVQNAIKYVCLTHRFENMYVSHNPLLYLDLLCWVQGVP